MDGRMGEWSFSPLYFRKRMDKEMKRLERRQQLMDNKAYQAICFLTRYMDRYYLDALIGVVPGWGDILAVLSVVPFTYFSIRIVKSVPLTLAVLNNALRDILLGMIPFFVGDIIDFFHRSNKQNMKMVQGFVDGDEATVREVNRRAWQSAAAIVVMLLLIALMVWLLVSLGSSMIAMVRSWL